METTTKRKRYEKRFKLDAVQLTQEQGNSVASVARDLGIDANTLHHRDGTLANVFDYIEVWYNRQRLYSHLGYSTPNAGWMWRRVVCA